MLWSILCNQGNKIQNRCRKKPQLPTSSTISCVPMFLQNSSESTRSNYQTDMVVRCIDKEPFYLKIDGRWVYVDDTVLSNHPGGSAITTYRNKDDFFVERSLPSPIPSSSISRRHPFLSASTVFHSFHAGSKQAYIWLQQLKGKCPTQDPKFVEEKEELLVGYEDVNMGQFDITEEKSIAISRSFDRLRLHVSREGLLNGSFLFYGRKVTEALLMIALAIYLQLNGWYITSALLMGLVWQQLGWLIHEFAHNQLFKNHWHNDLASYFVGNLLQGFSSGGWKEQHNIHHAATNIVGRDSDLDLMPLWATVVQDLKMADNWWLTILPYQHIYWTVMLPFLRFSWLLQSLVFVSGMSTHYYKQHRERAVYEQVTLTLHWILVIGQLYLLPSLQIRLIFFAVSQLFGGFLLAHVVTYNHYSVCKFPYNSKIMSNYACLQLHTTRNMRPGIFIDWLWGGLNYQIEHHLFPTMPRNNLSKVMPLVKQFCAENDLPYMVDDYFTGFKLELQQFANVARIASKMKSKIL